MKAKVERLRVGLVAGTLLLLVVLVGALSYSRYQAGKAWFRKLKKQSGASVVQETDGFTYSQSLRGKTLFTLHAAKAFQHADGQYTLHNVVITVYGAHEGQADRIYGKEFEWDEAKGIARALGDTEMDLQVSVATASRERASAVPVSDASVHVKTAGLIFLRKLGVAATTESVEIRYRGLLCTAKGAEFDSSPSELHLLADVRVSGLLRGAPVSLTAVKADFARESNMATFLQPVAVSADSRAQAAIASLYLRSDGSIEHTEGTGGVVLENRLRRVTSPRMDATFNENNAVQSAHFAGGVQLADDDKQRPSHGETGDMRVKFDQRGRPVDVSATSGAHLLVRQAAANGFWLERDLRGEKVLATFLAQRDGKAHLQQVHAIGSAAVRGDALTVPAGGRTPELSSTTVNADDLLANFIAVGSNGVRLDNVHGLGHTVLQQKGLLGVERTSSADSLDVLLAPVENGVAGKLEVASAREDGHVTIRSRSPAKSGSKSKQDDVVSGTADHALYDGRAEMLTLTGSAHLTDAATSVTADSVVLQQTSGDSEARGNVVTTLINAGAQATHVSAQHAALNHATQVAAFDGDEVHPARMWQEASQVEAATLLLDGRKHTLIARPASATGTVHSVFAGERRGKRSDTAEAAQPATPNDGVLRVESRQVDYSDASREAIFDGPVVMQGATGEVRAQRAIAFFSPTGAGPRGTNSTALPTSALESVVASGDVRLLQPGREGVGDVLTFRATDNSFVLTGAPGVPPRIVDRQQGTITGTSLLFRPGDSTIVVSGAAPGGPKRSRARIDTKVRQ